ncbi:hypothetical protein SBWP25_0023 [Pseudomonas phage phi2]|uniref:Hypothetical phage protein n=1 Tax=Pseudomonas phage phi2 TaxID=1450169 RepID=D2EBS7_9CAUD|nr:hypothetical protein SBWP25_0023 [Pseudomonas phage phi-2]CBH51593.1 hypothetical phage protein [Pseudomonas phage phi-2]
MSRNIVEVHYTKANSNIVGERRFLLDGSLFLDMDCKMPAWSTHYYTPVEGRPGVYAALSSIGAVKPEVTDILYLCACNKNSIYECPATCPNPKAQDIKNLHLAENAVPEVLSTEAKRDTGKPRFDLLEDGCPDALLDVVKVMTWAVEVKGYRAHSWKEVPEARRRYRAAMSRHRNALARGELLDEESSLPHEAHIACNAIFLAQLLYVQPE